MQYIVEIRDNSQNPNFPASIGILERPVYERIHGTVPSGNSNVAVLENPSKLIDELGGIQPALTVFDGGIAFMIKAGVEEKVRRLFQESIAAELTD